MKKYLLTGLMIAAATIGTANAQEISAPADRAPRVRTEKPVTPIARRAPVGAMPRAARGNPAQMINPAAPARYYGPPEETVSSERPADRTRNAAAESNQFPHTGLILFGLRF